jgi:transcriptional regulator with XRE-family HTH domain
VPTPAQFVSPVARLAVKIKTFRLARGLSQRQLASRMPVSRTYISKLENALATPTLGSLSRVAQALDVTVAELLSGGEKSRQDEIGELMRDPFVAAISAFLPRLSVAQRANVLAETRDLAERRRIGHGQVPFVVGAVAGAATAISSAALGEATSAGR